MKYYTLCSHCYIGRMQTQYDNKECSTVLNVCWLEGLNPTVGAWDCAVLGNRERVVRKRESHSTPCPCSSLFVDRIWPKWTFQITWVPCSLNAESGPTAKPSHMLVMESVPASSCDWRKQSKLYSERENAQKSQKMSLLDEGCRGAQEVLFHAECIHRDPLWYITITNHVYVKFNILMKGYTYVFMSHSSLSNSSWLGCLYSSIWF